MKDINKEEISDFERSWQKAFENAEAAPANDIWSAIDAELANQNAQKYRRKTIFYKWVAAASIVFAIGLSYFSYTISTSNLPMVAKQNESNTATASKTESKNEGLAGNFSIDAKGNEEKAGSADRRQMEQPIAEELNSPSILAQAGEKGSSEKVEKLQDEQFLSTDNEMLAQGNEPIGSGGNSSMAIEASEFESTPKKVRSLGNISETSAAGVKTLARSVTFNGIERSEAILGEESRDKVLLVSASLERLEGKTFDLKHYAELLDPPYLYAIPGVVVGSGQNAENEKKILWAGLNFGSSIFDPNFQQGSNFQPKTSPALSQTFAREAPQAATLKESTEAGVSYSLGLNFGVQLSEKWMIQSGVRYAHKSASTSSTTQLQNNVSSFKTPTYLGDMEMAVVNKAERNFSQQYDLLNSFEFASIPLKAGYLLIDSKVGLMLTAGIGADIFLSNTISETNDKLEDVTVDAGSDSPFREVNFNGLFGAEVFYKISRQYHLTLEPNYSIALSPFTKSSSEFKSHPQTFGITAGLKFYWK